MRRTNSKMGFVYFMVDRSLASLLWTYLIYGAIKVKVGYTNNLPSRRGTHQTGNSDRVWDIMSPLKFRTSTMAHQFEKVCHNALGDHNRVHGSGRGREWYWVRLRDLLRLKSIYLKLNRRRSLMWAVKSLSLLKVFVKIAKLVKNLLLWLCVIPVYLLKVLLTGSNALHRVYQKYISPHVRQGFDYIGQIA